MKTRGRPRHPETLTPRQQEVLALLRQGLTNEEIAERLGITLDGAKFHVSEILLRLGVDSRYEAATWRPQTEPQPARGRWAFALAPIALLHKLKWNAAGVIAASALTVAAAVGLALLAWGLVRTSDDRAAANATRESPIAMRTYDNPFYGIRLQFPDDWVGDPNYGGRLGDLWTAYVSPTGRADGFLQLDAATAPSLDEAVKGWAYHKLKPFGDNPVITQLSLPAGEATLISPGPGTQQHDPDVPYVGLATLVIPFPDFLRAATGSIPANYPYFELSARPEDIQRIAETLRFVAPAPDAPGGANGLSAPGAISAPGGPR